MENVRSINQTIVTNIRPSGVNEVTFKDSQRNNSLDKLENFNSPVVIKFNELSVGNTDVTDNS